MQQTPTFDLRYREDPSVYSRNAFFPSPVAELGGSGYLRDQRYVQVLVHPLQINPATGELRYHQRLTLEISFGTAQRGRTWGTSRDESPSFEKLLNSALLNYEAARAWRTIPEPDPQPMVQAATGSLDYLTPPSYKISVAQDGIYQVSYDDLEAAGLPVDDLNPRTFQLYNMGSEVAIYVEGEADGSFDPPLVGDPADEGDYVLFYGQKMDTKYTDTNIYWLKYGGPNGLRMKTKDGTPAGADPLLTFEHTVHLEEDHEYWSQVPAVEGVDHWYWNYWHTRWARQRTYVVSMNHISTGTHTCTLRPKLFGATDGEHNVELSVRGTVVGSATWNGIQPYPGEHTFPQSLLADGEIAITLRTLTPSSKQDTGVTDWFELDYYDTLTAEGDLLQFNAEVSGSESISYTYNVTGFVDADIDAFDITDPAQPRRITGANVSSSEPHTLTFQDTITRPTEYLALTSSRWLSPLGIELDAPSDLRDWDNGADYIIISHGDFITDLLPLAQYRASLGLRTVMTDVQNVYDEFGEGQYGHGVFDARAIRDFLAYAYENWAPPAPTYVLLVGDGHYDFKDNTGAGSENYIPPYLAMVDPFMGETAADNRYVTVNGADIVPDMHIGRLPANSRAETQAMVTKILSYEQTPPSADWHGRVLFLADNQPDEQDAGDFWDLSEDIAGNYLPGPYATTKVYFDKQPGIPIPGYPYPRPTPPFYPPAPDPTDLGAYARQALADAIDTGHLLVNYIGHGAPQQWAAEKLWRLEDIAALDNGGRLPVMLPWTCRDGYFIFPFARLSCLGESIVRAEEKGAIASWSPTGFGTCAGHHLLNTGFFTAVFRDDVREIGAATTQGKLFLWNNSGGAQSPHVDLMDTYVLFGDPAMRLNTLPAEVSIAKSVQPEGPVNAGGTLTYTLTYSNTGPATAHHVVISDILPSEFMTATFVSSGAAITPRAGTRFVWDVDDLEAGEGGTITITAILDPAFSGPIRNDAVIATSARDEKVANNAVAPIFTEVLCPVGGMTYRKAALDQDAPDHARSQYHAAPAAPALAMVLMLVVLGRARLITTRSSAPARAVKRRE
jgi:uncharacterized repeat protein (TIGR01451 family)